jgi:hypothetical protein
MSKDYLEKKGYTPMDITKGVIYFKVISFATYGATLAVCYRYQPLRRLIQTPMMKQRIASFETRFPGRWAQAEKFMTEKTTILSQKSWFKIIPDKLGLHAEKFTQAVCENIIGYKMLLPVILPAQFLLTMQLIKH